MKNKPILIVAGEPKSIFFEIFFKSLKKKIKSPIILICSLKILKKQMRFFNFRKDLVVLNLKSISDKELNNKKLNIIDVYFQKSSRIKNKTKNKNKYIENCFETAFFLIKKNFTYKLINGPIKKSTFLNKNFLGITEYISANFDKSDSGMLIYNKKFSVCPLTTHLPIKLVSKNITKKLILDRLLMISNFYKKLFKYKPKIGVTGLNPHCESVLKVNEDFNIVTPAIKMAKIKGLDVSGPYSADTVFLKQNRNRFNIILGMYHDQVLTPIKTLFEYDAINITMGLPFLRVSPDHGPNEKMVGKNLSNPTSLIRALEFLDRN